MVKNKEQVRHFYYRTWHKITKYIDFDNGECPPPPPVRLRAPALAVHVLPVPWVSRGAQS